MLPRDRKLPIQRILAAGALTGLAAFVLVPVSGVLRPASAEQAQVVPAPAKDEPLAATSGPETAVLAGGCFWGVQAVFQHTDGVINAVSGYSGGSEGNAIYEVVSSGTTGHAESVEITYDPSKITFGKLLQIYFSVAHDPTQLNYQGPDYGPQYRSAIFTANDMQTEISKAYIAQLDAAKVFDEPIVTQLNALDAFYPAEDYHQDYATLHPDQPYIAYHDLPKLRSLEQLFPDVYRETPALVRTAATQ